ncbi:HlyD family secretion protein [Neorhodopirellula pilleata]|uniref:Multidrug resistance protein MdtA n=1 Tax=Neorhodopirellula pilleata TaxID=2714738 RepID=A0A5C5ZL85_9BACT|nr:HlyD family efflux transporter periplasmic adaptor subunit [Neorhodopirellula pilleata]TWT87958.1 Multidrug resistance protein MdtA [Neorhodopirellula pilleata]
MVISVSRWNRIVTLIGLTIVLASDGWTATIDGLVVALVDEAVIVSRVEGPVEEVSIEEGQLLQENELVAKLDDRRVQIHEQLAAQDLAIAESAVKHSHRIDAARSAAATQRHRVSEQAIRLEIDRRRAANELKVLAAEKAEAAAKNEWERARTARENFTDSVSESELESLRLAYERSELESQEARFQNQIAELEARLGEMAAETGRSQLESATIEIAAAESERTILELEVAIKRLNRQLAEVEAADRQIRSPIAGRAVAVAVRPGDWVRPGDLVARVISLTRLRVEGFAPAATSDRLRDEPTVRIAVDMPDGSSVQIKGQSRFVSPEVDPVTGEVRFWIEFDNPGERVRPGYRAKLIMETD